VIHYSQASTIVKFVAILSTLAACRLYPELLVLSLTILQNLPQLASLSDEQDSLTGMSELRMFPESRHPVSSHPFDRISMPRR
jgi:hypothetical protein